MMQAMANAPLGDDVFGDDPTVKPTQEMAAERLGKEAALFMPSGTMDNLTAVLHTADAEMRLSWETKSQYLSI
jgi:threonine aldolase